ncbi:hypothetical protein AB0N09_05565 [Streptomyces erythrochromogenes]|uniref:hypothetical protein n=1 Tax=Streptomyces erythrochromogenes TaxID=285574 RepID=UPI003434FCC4
MRHIARIRSLFRLLSRKRTDLPDPFATVTHLPADGACSASDSPTAPEADPELERIRNLLAKLTGPAPAAEPERGWGA